MKDELLQTEESESESVGRTINDITEAVSKLRILLDSSTSVNLPVPDEDEDSKLQKEWLRKIATYQRKQVSSVQEEEEKPGFNRRG